MEIDDVFDELHDAADGLGIVAPDFGTSKGKAYEVWIMLEIVVRLLRDGVDVHPHDCADELEPYFRVSGSPADMPSHAAGATSPCHFKLRRGRRSLELHLGLNHGGLSTATHEIDLSVLPGFAAWKLRQEGGGPYEREPFVGLELKAYSDKHKLPHDIPRALLGVAMDLDPAFGMYNWTVTTFGGESRTFHRSNRMQLAVITATKLHDSSERLLLHHGVGAHCEVLPGANAAIDDVAMRILKLLE